MRPGPNRRDRWKGRIATAPGVPAACRLFCFTTLAKYMNASGIVSRPRYKLAREVGCSERRITQFITQAKEAGWLIVVQPGYRTMTAVYQATFPDAESGNGSGSLSTRKRGKDAGPLSEGTNRSPIQAGKGERTVPSTSSYLLEHPETAVFPLHADGSEIDFDDASIKIKPPTTHLRVVNG